MPSSRIWRGRLAKLAPRRTAARGRTSPHPMRPCWKSRASAVGDGGCNGKGKAGRSLSYVANVQFNGFCCWAMPTPPGLIASWR